MLVTHLDAGKAEHLPFLPPQSLHIVAAARHPLPDYGQLGLYADAAAARMPRFVAEAAEGEETPAGAGAGFGIRCGGEGLI